MKRSRLQSMFVRVVTVLMLLVMLGGACLPTAAQVITVPGDTSSENPYATFEYSDGVFNIRFNADALYEMLVDGNVTREELTRFIPDEVLDLFVNGTPSLDQMKSVLAKFITKEDMQAMIADLPLDVVMELFDFEFVTSLFSVEELMSLIDLESLLKDVNPELLVELLEGEEGAEKTPLDLMLENETLWQKVITDQFVEDLLGDENFLKLVNDPAVQANLRELLSNPDNVNYKVLLENKVFIQRVLKNQLVLPDLVTALVDVKNAEGNSIVFDLFSDTLLNDLLKDGLLKINDKTIAELVKIGAVKLDTESLSLLDFGKLLSDSAKLQSILDVLFEGEAGEARAAELAQALYNDSAITEKLQKLDLALLTEWGIVRLDGEDAQKILEQINLEPEDVLNYMPGKPELADFARAVLNLSGEQKVIDLAKFMEEFSGAEWIHIENLDLKQELLPKLDRDQKIELGKKYAKDIKLEDYLNKQRFAQQLMGKMSDDKKLELAKDFDIEFTNSNYVKLEDLKSALMDAMSAKDKLEFAKDKCGITIDDPKYFKSDDLVKKLKSEISNDESKAKIIEDLAEQKGVVPKEYVDPATGSVNTEQMLRDLMGELDVNEKLKLIEDLKIELKDFFALDVLTQDVLLSVDFDDAKELLNSYPDIKLENYANWDTVFEQISRTISLDKAEQLAETYRIDLENGGFFDYDEFVNDVLEKISASEDDKRGAMLDVIQRGWVTINDLATWGVFSWSDITLKLLMNASDDSVNKTNLFNYIKSQIEEGYGLSNWMKDLFQNNKITFGQLKDLGVISIDTTAMEKLMNYRDAEGNPIITPADLLRQNCVKGWLSDTDLMVALFNANAITIDDLKAWGLLDLNKVFATYKTPAALEEAGIMTQADLNKVMQEYIKLEDIQNVILNNNTAFSKSVDVLIKHLSDIWNDFVECVDFAAVFPDKQAIAKAITYQKIIEILGLPTLIEKAGGVGTLLGYYKPEELGKILELISPQKLQQFVTDAGLLEKLDLKELAKDFIELAKSKEGLKEKLEDELALRVASLFGEKTTRFISINDEIIFMHAKYAEEYMYEDVATSGAFDMNRVLAALISALPDVNDFLAMGDNADLFSLILNWDMTPNAEGEARFYSFGVKFGFIGSLEKLQSLVEPYRDRFTIDTSYDFELDKEDKLVESSVTINVAAELPSVVGTAYEILLQINDDEIHEFLVDLPNLTIYEIVDFLSGLTDTKLESLSEKLAARSDTIREKLTTALAKAGGRADAISQKAEAILNKITTPGGLVGMRNRIVSALKGRLVAVGNRTVDSFYNPKTGSFDLPYEKEVSLLEKLDKVVTLPEEIALLFENEMNITMYLKLSLKVVNIHRMEVIRSDKPVTQTETLGSLLGDTPVENTGISTTILYSVDGAKPEVFYKEALYKLDDPTHTALTAMPSESTVLIDSGVRTMVFDYQYEGSTDGVISDRLLYAAGYEKTSIYKLPDPSDGVTLNKGYHYVWTVNDKEIADEDALYEAMKSNDGHMTVKLVEKQPVITLNGVFEQASDKDGFIASFPYTPGATNIDTLWDEIVTALNAQKGKSHNYQAMLDDGSLYLAIAQIVKDAAANDGPYDQTVTVQYDLNLYKVTLKHKGEMLGRYVYKHGTTTLLDPITLEPATIVAAPRGYAWPEIEFKNKDWSYNSYAIEYTIVVGGVSYTVTIETPLIDGKAWESFLAAHPTAPEKPDSEDADFEYYWVLESNGLRPSDDASGFILPADPDFDWSKDPNQALFVLKVGRTRTHGYLAFYNEKGEQIGESYRYELGKHNFDFTGRTYGIALLPNCNVKFYDEAGNEWVLATLNTAHESGTYNITVKYTVINKDQLTIYGTFEGDTVVHEVYFGEYDFIEAPDTDTYNQLIQDILNALDAKTKDENGKIKYQYDVEALKTALNEYFEKAFASTEAYGEPIQMTFNLKTYTVTLKHKGSELGSYVYKYGTTTLLDADLNPVTKLPPLPDGYAWPEIPVADFEKNENLSYSSYAITYQVSFTVNGETTVIKFTIDKDDSANYYKNIKVPTIPDMADHESGWYDANGNKFDWDKIVVMENDEITIHDNLEYTAKYHRIAGRVQFLDKDRKEIGSHSYKFADEETFDLTGAAYRNEMKIPLGYHFDKFVDADGNVVQPLDLTKAPDDGAYVVYVVFAPNKVTISFTGSFEQIDTNGNGGYKKEDIKIDPITYTFSDVSFDGATFNESTIDELLTAVEAKLKQIGKDLGSHNCTEALKNLKTQILAIIKAGATSDGEYAGSIEVTYDLNFYTVTLKSYEKGNLIATYDQYKYKHGMTMLWGGATLPTLSRGYAWPELPVADFEKYDNLSYDSYAIVYTVTFRLPEPVQQTFFRMRRQAEDVFTFTYTYDDFDAKTGKLILKAAGDAEPIYEVTFDPDTGAMELTDEVKERLAEELPKRGYTVEWPDQITVSEEPPAEGEEEQVFVPEIEIISYYATFMDGDTVIADNVEFTVEGFVDAVPLVLLTGYKDVAWEDYSWLFDQLNEDPSLNIVRLQKTAIEYTIVVGGVSYTVTIETPLTDGKTAWESFLAAHPTAPEKPETEDADFDYYWVLKSNNLRPSNSASGFILPADFNFDWSRDPSTPLYVLEAARTRMYGHLEFYDADGNRIGESYRYKIGNHNLDFTGNTYGIVVPEGYHIDKFVGENDLPLDLTTAPEPNGTYVVTVHFAPNQYNVTFVGLNGETYEEGAYLYGATSLVDAVPKAPSKLGYYVDWFYDADGDGELEETERITDWEFLSEMSGDLTVQAVAYEAIQYTVTVRVSDEDADEVTFTYTLDDYNPETGKLTVTVSGKTYELDFDPETGKLTLSDEVKQYLDSKLPVRGVTVTWPDEIEMSVGQGAQIQLRPQSTTLNTYWVHFVDKNGSPVAESISFDVTTKEIPLPDRTYPGYEVAWSEYTLPYYTTEVPHDITVVLHKTAITYTITFMDGDTPMGYTTFNVESDLASLMLPAIPDRPGYTGAWESFTLIPSDITVKLIWTRVEGPGFISPGGGTDAPDADEQPADYGWIVWLVIGVLGAGVVTLLVIFLVMKNKDDDDDDDNTPEPIVPVVVPEPEAEAEVEPVAEPVVEPVAKTYEPAVVKATYLSATSRAVINLCDLESRFAEGDVVTLELLQEMKLVSKKEKRLKVLGSGTITKAMTVKADYFSGSAAEKIRAAGGTPVYKQ